MKNSPTAPKGQNHKSVTLTPNRKVAKILAQLDEFDRKNNPDKPRLMLMSLARLATEEERITVPVKITMTTYEWMKVAHEAVKTGGTMDKVLSDLLTSQYPHGTVFDGLGN